MDSMIVQAVGILYALVGFVVGVVAFIGMTAKIHLTENLSREWVALTFATRVVLVLVSFVVVFPLTVALWPLAVRWLIRELREIQHG